MSRAILASRRHRLAPAALAIGLALGSASCTLIVDQSAAQCESDADCSDFPGTACSTDNVCDKVPCAATRECLDRLGDYHVCHHGTSTCVHLRSDACTTVEGDYESEDAFLFGAVVPMKGVSSETGVAVQSAIKLAIRDFQLTSNGLPPKPGASAQRPLVLIGCNDDGDADAAVVAAKHLIGVGVPAIVGAAFSGITLRMATEATIPGQVLVISPSSTSVALTDLPDDGLVWRTSPSDIYQAKAMHLYVPSIEADLRASGELPVEEPLKLAILHKGDSYGRGLGQAVEKELVLNNEAALDPSNAANYVRFDYGDPNDETNNPTKYTEAIGQALALHPHVLLVLGTGEAVAYILPGIEAGWSGPVYRPRYVLSDGTVVDALWSYVATNTDLRRRLTGTVPGANNLLFNAFKADYKTQFPGEASPDIFGAAGAYDATYLLAYSAVSLGAAPITGPSLAEGLKKMVPPSPNQVDVGTGGINGTFTKLSQGESIDFNGASGPLDFDVVTGEAPSDIQIWCLPASAGGAAQSAIGSGLYLDAKTQELVGQIGSVCD